MAETVEFWDYPISIKQLYETYGVTPDEINELNNENYTEDYLFTGGASIKLPATKVRFETSPTGQPQWLRVEGSSEPVSAESPDKSTTYREAGEHPYIATNPSNDTEEFLQQWWEAQGHDPLFYDEAQAEAKFIQYWERELKKLADVQKFYSDLSEDTPDWLQSEQSIMEYFAPLIEEQGIAVLPQAFLDTYNYLEQDNFTYGEDNPIIIDAIAFLNADARDLGQPLPYDPYATYNENLAYEYYVDHVLDDVYSDEGGYLGLILGMLGGADSEVIASLIASSPNSAMWQTMQPYINQPLDAVGSMIEHWGDLSLEEQVALAHSLAYEYSDTATELGSPTDPANYVLDQTREQTLAFLDQQALDQIRVAVFEPWDPDAQNAKLAKLNEEIGKMKTSILGVDIAWVRDTFQAYHDKTAEFIPMFTQWREDMRPGLEQIELEMLAKEDEELVPFWWLELVGSVLFEPLDWLLTARDLLSGDWGALIGFLPLIPASIRNIADAGRYMSGETLQIFRKILSKVGDEKLTEFISYAEGSKHMPPGSIPVAVPNRWATYDDAKKWFKEEYDIDFDANDLDIRSINLALDQFDILAKQYPEVANRLSKFVSDRSTYWKQLGQQPLAETTYGIHVNYPLRKGGPFIVLNSQHFDNPDWFLRENIGLGFDPKKQLVGHGVRPTITHEFGEAIWAQQFTNADNAFRSTITTATSGYNYGLVRDTVRAIITKNADDLDEISVYAWARVNEVSDVKLNDPFSEAFVAIQHLDPEEWEGTIVEGINSFLTLSGNSSSYLPPGQYRRLEDLNDLQQIIARQEIITEMESMFLLAPLDWYD